MKFWRKFEIYFECIDRWFFVDQTSKLNSCLEIEKLSAATILKWWVQLKLAQSSQYVKYSLQNSPTVVSSLRSAIHRRLWPPGRQILGVGGRGQRGEVIVEPQVPNVVGVCPPPPRHRVRSLEDYFLRHAVSVSVSVHGRGGGLGKFSSDLRRDQGKYHRRFL